LLSAEDIARTLREFRRVLRDEGKLTLVLIGQNTQVFNTAYKLATKVAPAFWGRQVERGVPEMISLARFEILHDRKVQQGFYPSRVLVAKK
jgi:ubiquinone/menaquinone biosynthesis C-methylase UbiE